MFEADARRSVALYLLLWLTLAAGVASGCGDASADAEASPAVSSPEGGAVAAPGADAGTDASPGDAGDAGEPFDIFSPSHVPTFELTLDDEAIAVFSDHDVGKRKTWVRGTFRYGDTVIADVGVRRKGEQTFRALPGKAALKIRFDRYVDGQRFMGLTDLTLNNSITDPSCLSERVTYHVFRAAGLPAQKANSAVVKINGESFGLYVNVETPGQDLLDRLYGAKAATLYEAVGAEWAAGMTDGLEEDVGEGSFADVLALFEVATNAQPATLLPDVAAHLDTRQWLRFSAAEAVVGHYDGYGFARFLPHNYFLAGDEDGVFTLLPWSTDSTLSNRHVTVNVLEPRSANEDPSLLVRCKSSPPCWTAYREQVTEVLAVFESQNLYTLARAWHDQIHPLVLADTKREASDDLYETETNLLYQYVLTRPSAVRSQLSAE